MDRKQDWKWLPAQMPGVARLLAERRARVGADWVNTCWRHGVLERQAGWFFAAEGALAVGVPWAGAPGIDQWLALQAGGQFAPCLLILREEGAAGATG